MSALQAGRQAGRMVVEMVEGRGGGLVLLAFAACLSRALLLSRVVARNMGLVWWMALLSYKVAIRV